MQNRDFCRALQRDILGVDMSFTLRRPAVQDIDRVYESDIGRYLEARGQFRSNSIESMLGWNWAFDDEAAVFMLRLLERRDDMVNRYVLRSSDDYVAFVEVEHGKYRIEHASTGAARRRDELIEMARRALSVGGVFLDESMKSFIGCAVPNAQFEPLELTGP